MTDELMSTKLHMREQAMALVLAVVEENWNKVDQLLIDLKLMAEHTKYELKQRGE